MADMEKYLEKENCYLGEHPGVSVTKALDVARERLKKLKLETWVQIKEEPCASRMKAG